MSTDLRRRRFTVDDYYRMAEAGVLREDDRVELIEGEIVEMSPIGIRHAGCVNRLTRIFFEAVGDRASIAVQNPVRVSDISEPQPDLIIATRRDDDYSSAHPRPEDVLLLIEAGDASLPVDRNVKAPLYAVAGIIEYWIVDFQHGMLEVFRDPAASGYQVVQRLSRGETVRPIAFPDVTIAVEDIAGPMST